MNRFNFGSVVFAIIAGCLTACGPGTNPGSRAPAALVQPPETEDETPRQQILLDAYGPHYASGQGSGFMGTPQCNSTSGRPCLSARASAGMAYHFDSNTSDGAAPIGGTPPVGAHTTTAGAGKTKVVSGPNAPDFPRVENRDLRILQRQAKGQELAF